MAIIVCPECGAKNRVDEETARTLRPFCGRCKAELPVAESVSSSADITRPQIVTDSSFQQIVLNAGPRPVLLDCWAPWCGPCRTIAPIMDQLAAQANGKYVIAKLNTDENPRVAGQYRIDAIPTMLLFKNGQLVDRIVGLQPKQAIEQKLRAHA